MEMSQISCFNNILLLNNIHRNRVVFIDNISTLFGHSSFQLTFFNNQYLYDTFSPTWSCFILFNPFCFSDYIWNLWVISSLGMFLSLQGWNTLLVQVVTVVEIYLILKFIHYYLFFIKHSTITQNQKLMNGKRNWKIRMVFKCWKGTRYDR